MRNAQLHKFNISHALNNNCTNLFAKSWMESVVEKIESYEREMFFRAGHCARSKIVLEKFIVVSRLLNNEQDKILSIFFRKLCNTVRAFKVPPISLTT